MEKDPKYHYHEPKPGFFVRCYHQCRHWASPGFLCGWIVASTITFPLEHILFFRTWPLNHIGHFVESGKWNDATGVLPMPVSIAILSVWVLCIVVALYFATKHFPNNQED